MIFAKMHGNGNDFIVIDDRAEKYIHNQYALAEKICHRHFGIGGDGILLVRNSSIADISMVIINSDGSAATMCGNGLRCFVKYVYEKAIVNKTTITVETGDGIKIVEIKVENNKVAEMKVNMGKPTFDTKAIPVLSEEAIINKPYTINGKEYVLTSLHLGVPHTIVFGNLKDYSIEEGRYIEKYDIFPKGTNVNFCEIVDRSNIRVKTWERGAGSTLACGTGNCSAAFAAYNNGFIFQEVSVHIAGGILKVKIEDEGVYMIGNADFVFEGSYFSE